ncbi:MAG: cobalamin-dependent protein [Saprospirales bacterium]|nr:cobalamin-dependent protein [Saprospirales bacterium]
MRMASATRSVDESKTDVLLVGYENQENIGLRSIMSYLLTQGYQANLAPFQTGSYAEVLAAARRYQPRVIGFSLIFQYALEEFDAIMSFLRKKGVRAHFTAGGHFPSLRPAETLELLPHLDSIVRFEGELTILELLRHFDHPEKWPDIQGLAFRKEGAIMVTPPRPLVKDLDSLPVIFRDQPRVVGDDIRMASMLASRGCLFNCSFCSIRQFYEQPPGPLRRFRSPEAVVSEMVDLYEEKDVRLFIFQDDDFPVRTARERKWLNRFLQAMKSTGLGKEVRWKVSCRVDDLDPATLDRMMDQGLMAVYLGVESGSEEGLKALNKRVTPTQNRAAIDLFKSHDLALAIGFMLFDPSSTLASVQENIDFLHAVGEDGYFPINFCKMLPYVGTPVETQLRAEGRLKGTVAHPDYNFLDPRLDAYAFLVQRIFSKRNFSADSGAALLQKADFQHRLAKSFHQDSATDEYGKTLRALIARSNNSAVATLQELLEAAINNDLDQLASMQDLLVEIAAREWQEEAEIENQVLFQPPPHGKPKIPPSKSFS